MQVSIKVWGDFACFTRSDARLDRVSYDVPTPSACRGILEAIYCKPIEFWYEIREISILNPIEHINIMKNEVKKKGIYRKESFSTINVDSERTQRCNSYLKNVAYIITADIHVRKSFSPEIPMYEREQKILAEFKRRVKGGKCFAQPYLGTKECMCFFSLADGTEVPQALSRNDLGVMLYDIFDPESNVSLNTDKKNYSGSTRISYYWPILVNGIIKVPKYNSDDVLKI